MGWPNIPPCRDLDKRGCIKLRFNDEVQAAPVTVHGFILLRLLVPGCIVLKEVEGERGSNDTRTVERSRVSRY